MSHYMCKVLLKACAFFATVSCAAAYCQQGWTYYNVTHSCFYASPNKYTYVDGREYCRNQSAFVASIKDDAQDKFMGDNGVVAGSTTHYLGSFNGSLTWDDGTHIQNSKYTPTGTGQAASFFYINAATIIRSKTSDATSTFNVLCEKAAVAICSNITDVVVNTQNTTEGTVVTYQCPQGSWFSSAEYGASATTTCHNSTVWLPAVRSCQGIICNVTAVTQGTSNVSSTLNYTDVVRYTCNNGYEIPGGSSTQDVTCTNGSITPIPCQVITCHVNSVANAAANASSVTFGQAVQYTCTNGYTLTDGSTTIQTRSCSSGNITANDCQVITCNVTAIANGAANTSSLTYGQMVEYTCTQGYRFSDNTTSKQAQCVSGNVNASGCSIVTCSVPTGVLSTENITGSTVNYGETVRYTCNPGNQFADGTTEKDYSCGSSGTISVVSCQAIATSSAAVTTSTAGITVSSGQVASADPATATNSVTTESTATSPHTTLNVTGTSDFNSSASYVSTTTSAGAMTSVVTSLNNSTSGTTSESSAPPNGGATGGDTGTTSGGGGSGTGTGTSGATEAWVIPVAVTCGVVGAAIITTVIIVVLVKKGVVCGSSSSAAVPPHGKQVAAVTHA